MTTNPAISASGLSKSYGDHVVLDGIDLEVPTGTVFGLLGPNGAGKTTTVQILSTLIRPDAGEVRVSGHDLRTEPDAVRATIGVTGQFSAVDGLLTGRENLRLMADLHRLERSVARQRIDDLLDRFDLVEAAAKAASTYSGGMRRKLDIAMTLIGTPGLIFLDEPTTGLDPRSRLDVWQIVRDLVADGTTIFLTTQHLDEADRLADRVAVLDGGRIVAEGSPAELKRSIPGGYVHLQFVDAGRLDDATRVLPHGADDREALTLDVPSDGSVASLRDLLARLGEASIEVDALEVRTPSLDDVFLALTGHPSTTPEEPTSAQPTPELEVAR